jgi:transcriptional regulator with XRE-family HTH domain
LKSLRLKKHWSQEELAQMSNLNVRTIQRVEKGESVGVETLKSLAAVFEISTDELKHAIEREKQPSQQNNVDTKDNNTDRAKALEKVKSIKYFYAFTAFLAANFLLFMLPSYNDGENLGPLVAVFVSFSAMIIGYAIYVFQPFGEDWEKRKVSQLLKKQRDTDSKR